MEIDVLTVVGIQLGEGVEHVVRKSDLAGRLEIRLDHVRHQAVDDRPVVLAQHADDLLGERRHGAEHALGILVVAPRIGNAVRQPHDTAFQGQRD